MMVAKKQRGRPTQDFAEQIDLAWDYLSNYKRLKEVIPTVVGYAQFCRASGFPVSRDTIYERPDFSDIREQIREIQERELVNGALKQQYHPRFSQFLLASKHDYVEKQGRESTADQMVGR